MRRWCPWVRSWTCSARSPTTSVAERRAQIRQHCRIWKARNSECYGPMAAKIENLQLALHRAQAQSRPTSHLRCRARATSIRTPPSSRGAAASIRAFVSFPSPSSGASSTSVSFTSPAATARSRACTALSSSASAFLPFPRRAWLFDASGWNFPVSRVRVLAPRPRATKLLKWELARVANDRGTRPAGRGGWVRERGCGL